VRGVAMRGSFGHGDRRAKRAVPSGDGRARAEPAPTPRAASTRERPVCLFPRGPSGRRSTPPPEPHALRAASPRSTSPAFFRFLGPIACSRRSEPTERSRPERTPRSSGMMMPWTTESWGSVTILDTYHQPVDGCG
jgi:hypothetical protein